MLKEPIPFMF